MCITINKRIKTLCLKVYDINIYISMTFVLNDIVFFKLWQCVGAYFVNTLERLT